MAAPIPVPCPQCGAANNAISPKCWVCHASLFAERNAEEQAPALRPAPPSPVAEWIFGVSTIVVLIVLLLVGIGVAQDSMGGLIAYCLFIAPALIAMALRSKKPNEASVSWATRFGTLMLSLVMTMAVVWGLFIAAIAAMFVACLASGGKF